MNNRIFVIDNNRLKLAALKIAIPEDEPIFILRARNKKALSTIRIYQSTMRPTENCWKGLQTIIEEFTAFRKENPEKMKCPSEAY